MLIVGLSVTVGVLAATTAQVTNTIQVTYTSRKVAAVVSGQYQVLHHDAVDFETAGGDTTITFTGGESQGTAVGSFVAVNNITLTSTDNSVTFTYVIQNTSTTQALTAQVTLPVTRTNVTLSAGTASDGTDPVTVTAGTDHATDTFTVAAEATVTYTVTASITNLALDASFAGTFSWDLQ